MKEKITNTVAIIFFGALSLFIFLWIGFAQKKWVNHLDPTYEINIYPREYKMVIPEDVRKKISSSDDAMIKKSPLTYIKKLEKQIETLPLIDNAEVYYDATGKIHIDAYQFKPLAYVIYKGEKKYLDQYGRIRNLSKHKNLSLPVVNGVANKEALKKVHRVLKEMKKYPGLKSRLIKMEYNPRSIRMKLSGLSAWVVLGDTDRLENKFYKLELMDKALKKLNKNHRYIKLDLRYNGQVICQKN